MPAIAIAIQQFLAESQYGRDGVQKAIQDLARRIAEYEGVTDDLDIARAPATAGSTASAVVTSGEARVYAVIIQGNTTASVSYLRLFDAAVATTALAALEAVLPCAATTTTVWVPYPRHTFPSGLSMSVTSTANSTAAVTNLPQVYFLLRTSTTTLF